LNTPYTGLVVLRRGQNLRVSQDVSEKGAPMIWLVRSPSFTNWFEGSQKYLRWQDRAANQKFFAGEHLQFSQEAAQLLLEAGIIKQIPDLTKLADTQFIK
jgi:hypothetical protein